MSKNKTSKAARAAVIHSLLEHHRHSGVPFTRKELVRRALSRMGFSKALEFTHNRYFTPTDVYRGVEALVEKEINQQLRERVTVHVPWFRELVDKMGGPDVAQMFPAITVFMPTSSGSDARYIHLLRATPDDWDRWWRIKVANRKLVQALEEKPNDIAQFLRNRGLASLGQLLAA